MGRMLFLHSVGKSFQGARPTKLSYRPGLLLTMVATVPLLIYVFRKHVRNNAFVSPGKADMIWICSERQVNPGWLQHGSLIAATTCHYAAVSSTAPT